MTKVLLHGAGKEARAAAGFLQAEGHAEIALFDDGGGTIDGVRALTSDETRAFVRESTYLRSPGIPPSNELVKIAAAEAALATTPTGLWLRDYAPPGAVTITGTKGKSTTSALLASLLQAAGLSAKAYGNIGEPPLTSPLPEEEHPVVELSSYMMHDLPFTEHLHVVTCLFEDHLDWHGGKPAYHEAKLRPFRAARPAPGLAPAAVIAAHGLPETVDAIEDLVVDTGGKLSVGGHVIDTGPEDAGFAKGPLRRALQTAAGAALRFMDAGRAADAASQAAHGFSGLPSRQEIVPSTDGRIWVDDSLATIPEAALAAAERFAGQETVLVLGGADRGIDYAPLTEALEGSEMIRGVGYGDAAARMGGLATVAESFEAAIEEARALCPVGGVVLFAPAAPSSPPHRNYLERSAVFRACAKASR